MKYELKLTVWTEWEKPGSDNIFDVGYTRKDVLDIIRDAESVQGDVKSV